MIPISKTEKLLGWVVFLLATAVYALTCLPGIGFWDSPEFIASNYKLQVTHPPGAPLYTIMSRVIIALVPSENVALISNMISVVFGGFAMQLLFHITSFVGSKLYDKVESSRAFGIEHVAGFVGALSFAFCHSFWTSATETEVYTLSFFMLNLTLWFGLQWSVSDGKTADRLFVLICFLLGLSIGIHMINLSAVIPLAVLYGFTKYSHSWKTFVLSTIAGVMIFVLLFGLYFQGFLSTASRLDMLLVNSFGLPVNAGIYILFVLLISFLSVAAIVFPSNRFRAKTMLIPGVLMFTIGWSSYALPLIRYNSETAISHGVRSPMRLAEYIRAEQFGMGKVPLLKGSVFNAPLNSKEQFVDGPAKYAYNEDKAAYERSNNGKYTVPNYAKEFDLLFPRMYHRSTLNVRWYNQWVAMRGQDVYYDVNGKTEKFVKPTMMENLKFFFNYQVNWLNLRYVMWNFVGRQNDNKGTGLISNGNWITGFDALDAPRVGSTSVMPERFRRNKSRDSYWLLPFLLGLAGAAFLFYRSKQYFLFLLFVFLTFGLGITIYVNPLPQSVLTRERDYIFMGASMVFAMCIGFSAIWIHQSVKFIKNESLRTGMIAAALLLASPIQLLAKGWDDHDRSANVFPRQLAKAYLDACPPNAVFITVGDNMTFPLLYMQEVEGYRSDVRVVNVDMLWLDWYIDRLKKKVNDSAPLKIQTPRKAYLEGVDQLRPLQRRYDRPAELTELLSFTTSDKTTIQWNMRPINYFPTDIFKLTVDSSAIVNGGTDISGMQVSYVPELLWKYSKDFFGINEVILLDIIANNLESRPICFAINGRTDHMLGLQEYLVHHGLVEQLLPVAPNADKINPKMVATDFMSGYLMDSVQFSLLQSKDGMVDYENEIISRDVIRKNYYFLAQSLLEKGDTANAIAVVERAEQVFPDSLVEYRQYAFSLGKIYHRVGEVEKSKLVVSTCIQNLENELRWFISVNPTYPIMNVRHVDNVLEMYEQMVGQAESIDADLANEKAQTLEALKADYESWRKVNWPF